METQYTAYFYHRDGRAWFHLDKPSTADVGVVPLLFDGPAEEHHYKSYPAEYADFTAKREQVVEVVTEMNAAAEDVV